MSTISVPLSKESELRLDELVSQGIAPTRAGVMRRALEKLSEDAAVRAVLEAEAEPTIRGDLRALSKKLRRA